MVVLRTMATFSNIQVMEKEVGRTEKHQGHKDKKKKMVKWMMKHIWKAYMILLYTSHNTQEFLKLTPFHPRGFLLNIQVMPLDLSMTSVEFYFKNQGWEDQSLSYQTNVTWHLKHQNSNSFHTMTKVFLRNNMNV